MIIDAYGRANMMELHEAVMRLHMNRRLIDAGL